MNNVSATGENLSILISCDYTVPHNWMTFLCWYSISKNLPDAQITIGCNRTLMNSKLFGWTRMCKVPFELHKVLPIDEQIDYLLQKEKIIKPCIILKPETVIIRDFEESGFDTTVFKDGILPVADYSELCCDVKEDKPCVFVTYSNGWGKFVTSSWIHKSSCPFSPQNRFAIGNMTANEVRLGRLWSAVTPLFQTVSRG